MTVVLDHCDGDGVVACHTPTNDHGLLLLIVITSLFNQTTSVRCPCLSPIDDGKEDVHCKMLFHSHSAPCLLWPWTRTGHVAYHSTPSSVHQGPCQPDLYITPRQPKSRNRAVCVVIRRVRMEQAYRMRFLDSPHEHCRVVRWRRTCKLTDHAWAHWDLRPCRVSLV